MEKNVTLSFLNGKERNVLNGKERDAQPCYGESLDLLHYCGMNSHKYSTLLQNTGQNPVFSNMFVKWKLFEK